MIGSPSPKPPDRTSATFASHPWSPNSTTLPVPNIVRPSPSFRALAAHQKGIPPVQPRPRLKLQTIQSSVQPRQPDPPSFLRHAFAVFFRVIGITCIGTASHCIYCPLAVRLAIVGGHVRDSMTFRAFTSEVQIRCKLCSANAAVLEFDILSADESSRQQGACCTACAANILGALAGVKPRDLPSKIS